MRKTVFVTMLLALGSSAFAAEEGLILTGNKLKDAVSGKTVYLMTPVGSEIPIRYQPNGTLQGTISPSLAALGGEKVAADSGRWWVVREKLCQRWRNWADARSHCYKLRTAGDNVQWERNDGQSGTARIGK
jgi:hypothetical protein